MSVDVPKYLSGKKKEEDIIKMPMKELEYLFNQVMNI